MIVSKGISVYKLVRWSGHHIIWLIAMMTSHRLSLSLFYSDDYYSLAAGICSWYRSGLLCRL
jgi:hypothetical protein